MSYQITLTNFRGFENLSISLPTSGIILLDGRSGIGKTTLLEAISFALYDGPRTGYYPRLQHSENRKEFTSVSLTCPNGLNIYRQRRPGLLQVTFENKTLVDESAQSYLESLFGSSTGWNVGGYLKQGELCQFITMSAVDKLDFIQHLALPEQVDILFDRTNNGIHELNKQIESNGIEIAVSQNMYMQLYNQCTDKVKSKKLWSKERSMKIFQKYGVSTLHEIGKQSEIQHQSNLDLLNSQIQEERTRLALIKDSLNERSKLIQERIKLEGSLRSCQYHDLTEIEGKIQSISEQIIVAQNTERKTKLIAIKTNLKSKLSKISKSDRSIYTPSQLDNFEKILQGMSKKECDNVLSQIILTREYNEAMTIFKTRQRYENELNSVNKEIIGIQDKMNRLWREDMDLNKENISKKIKDIKDKIQSAQYMRLECPCCGKQLCLVNDHLYESQEDNVIDINLLYQQSKELDNVKILYEDFNIVEKKREEIQKKIDEIPNIKVPQKPQYADQSQINLDNMEAKAMKQKAALDKLPDIIIADERKKIQNSSEIDRLTKEIEEIEREYQSFDDLASTDDITMLKNELDTDRKLLRQYQEENSKITEIRAQLSLINRQIDSIPETMPDESNLERLQDEMKRLVDQHNKFKDDLSAQIVLSRLHELYTSHEGLLKEDIRYKQKLQSYLKIKEVLKTSEHVMLEQILSEINTTIAEILGQLFEEPISVSIRSMKQMKTTERIKSVVNLEIMYKEAEFSNVNELSGGERSRVSLALTIAFACLGKYPFLLLDESLSTLDVVTKERAINVLHQYCTDRLIIAVNHDTNEGVYDHTVSLD